ncbi:HNH endonuclease [Sporosarcina sp. ANT_H38]|uniref:HNH endonuclease signature motif containing protein n=1 Tax=Sporosarcina sp. ANT_H38 TaxID=2597358 RepID=UPI0011F15063|nr:HNH endonuclease signature motif containing protein [Sporosarcina sp. ANT_H38]KAA0944169.1 HNH endonuclease [Sporosarcina sp. ANT_H38]
MAKEVEEKQRLIWKNAYGPIPNGHVVIFGDGNQCNCELNNLVLVSRRILSVLNGRNLNELLQPYKKGE